MYRLRIGRRLGLTLVTFGAVAATVGGLAMFGSARRVTGTLVPPAQGFAALTQDGEHLSTQQAAFSASVRTEDGAFGLSPAGSALPSPAQFATIGVERGGAMERYPNAHSISDGEGGLLIARGPVLEHVQVLKEGLELNWTFPAAPDGSGDALVRVQLHGLAVTRSSAQETLVRSVATGLDLRVNEARWVDASGSVTRIAQEVQGDVLSFRVPEALLRSSSYPAVLDPVVSPATIGQVAFDAGVANGTITKLTVGVSGPGSLATSDGAISCGTTCSASYTSDSVVTLTATPNAGGARFIGWSGFCSAGSNVCTVPMTRSRTLTAYFEPGTWPVKVVKTGGGKGAVTGMGIDCPATSSTCTVEVPNTRPYASATFAAAAACRAMARSSSAYARVMSGNRGPMRSSFGPRSA